MSNTIELKPSTRAADPAWPPKHDLFGVKISATNYDEAVDRIMIAAQKRQSAVAAFMAVHALVSAATDAEQRRRVNQFEIAAPDGQPVRAALNVFHKAGLTDRVYGPEMTVRLCRRAAELGIGVYFYGSYADVVEKLRENLMRQIPNLKIVGCEEGFVKPLTPAEDAALVKRINDSGAGLVFIGMGCPKQEAFAAAHRDAIHAVQLCVGAAFDFHAGLKKMAPPWMQRRGLEWLFRLTQEPKRLWKRYLVTNSLFCLYFAKRLMTGGPMGAAAR
jgi:exopolysaccharide biosynthesis WecB/TagA/CpsF family protein